jgi:hypothetical protein
MTNLIFGTSDKTFVPNPFPHFANTCELIYGSKFVYNTAKASGDPDIQIQMQIHAEVYVIIGCDFHSKLDPQNGHS